MDNGDHPVKKIIAELFERLPEERQTFACVRGLSYSGGGAIHRFISIGPDRPLEESIADAVRAMEELGRQGLNVNLCLGLVDQPPEENKGISEEIVTGLFGFFTDADFAHEAHKNGKRYPPTIKDALECLPFAPSWAIHSGYGAHAVTLFEEPYFFESAADKQKLLKLSRQLGQASRQRARRKGWDLDATHEFTRGFRLPGTTNYKADLPPVLVRWVIHTDMRMDPSEVEERLASIAAYDPNAKDLPPQGYGEQGWRTSADYQGLSVVKGRELHPDRLNDLFDNDNSLFDAYEQKCKPKRKEKGYAASSRGDTSARDYKLALGAAKQGFTLQEAADLLIGCRAHNQNDFKRRDYYLRTIWRAREDATGEEKVKDAPTIDEILSGDIPPEEEEPAGEQPQQEQKGPTDEELIAALPARLRKLIPEGSISDFALARSLRVTRYFSKFLSARGGDEAPVRLELILKVESEEVKYNFFFNDGGNVMGLEDKNLSELKPLLWAFQKKRYNIQLPPPAQRDNWVERFRQLLFSAEVRLSSDATTAVELEEYIIEFCHSQPLVFTRENLAQYRASPFVEDNQIWIPVDEFINWLKLNKNSDLKRARDFWAVADPMGYRKKKFQDRKLGLFRSMARVPDSLIDIIEVVEFHNNRVNGLRGSIQVN